MQPLTRKQLIILVVLTLVWGINWPIMKAGITDYPPLTFRMISMWIGVPVLAGFVLVTRTSFAVPRAYWREMALLALTNMLIWQALMMIALQSLSSGRAAILGYTMPIFSAVLGALWFGNRLLPRAWGGVAAAALGVLLLLWHEVTQMSGRPVGVMLALAAASSWAVGTQLIRRTAMPVPTLVISFWMTLLAAVGIFLMAALFERDAWKPPSIITWGSIVYNGVLIFGFAQAAWFYLARSLPPVASSLSVMFIPVLGVFSGAWWLGEVLHWQDWAAVALMATAIASVLWPAGLHSNAAKSRASCS